MRQQVLGFYGASFFGTDYESGLGDGFISGAHGFGAALGGSVTLPVGGTIRSFRVKPNVALTGTDTQTFTYQKNGVDSSLSVALNVGTGTSIVADLVNSLTFAPGDRCTLKRVGIVNQQFQYTVQWEPTDPDVAIHVYGGGADGIFAGQTQYADAIGGGQWNPDPIQSIVSCPGTMVGLSLNIQDAPGVGKSWTATVMLNGVAQDGSGGTVDTRVTITGSATSGYVNFSLPLATNDRLSIRYTNAGTPIDTFGGGAVAIQSTTPNTWNMGGSTISSLLSPGSLYNYGASGEMGAPGASSLSNMVGLRTVSIIGMAFGVSNAPGLAGTGRAWTLEPQKNGASTGFSATVTETATFATSTSGAAFTITEGDTIGVHGIPTNSPANTGQHYWAFTVWDPDPPTVDAGPDQELIYPDDTVMDGSGAPGDGCTDTPTFLWTQVSGPATAIFADPTDPDSAVTLPAIGTYVFRLTATACGLSSSDTMTIVVSEETQPGPFLRRLRRAPHLADENGRIFFQRFQLDLEAGLGLNTGQGEDPQIMLRVSNDGGHTWGSERWVSAGRIGAYKARAVWHQLGQARDRVFEISMSDPIPWRIVDAYLDLKKGTS